MSPRKSGGRFSIADGMIVVAAAGWAIAWLRTVWTWEGIMGPAWLRGVTIQAVPGLTTASVCLLAIGLRRNSLARVAQRPGLALCLAASVAFVGALAKFALQYRLLFPTRPFQDFLSVGNFPFDATIFVAENTGLAVAAVYLNLVARRRWLPRPDWLDRLAFAVGLIWMVTILTMNLVL